MFFHRRSFLLGSVLLLTLVGIIAAFVAMRISSSGEGPSSFSGSGRVVVDRPQAQALEFNGPLPDYELHAESRLTVHEVRKISEASMTPELARVFLGRTKTEIKDVRHRAAISAAILSALCKSGEVDAAWSLVESGKGEVRKAGIGAVFSSREPTREFLISKFETLTETPERAMALEAMIGTREAEVAERGLVGIELHSQGEQALVATALANSISKHSQDKEEGAETANILLDQSIGMFRDGKIDAKAMSIILNDAILRDPFQPWETLSELHEVATPADLEEVHKALAQSMVKSDLKRAMELITTCPATKHSPSVIKRAVEVMYISDPSTANQWVAENFSIVDQITGQQLAASMARAAIQFDDRETALLWTEKLDAPELIAEILGNERPSVADPAKP